MKNAVKKWQMKPIGWLLLVWLDRVVHSAKSWFPLYLVGKLVVLNSLGSVVVGFLNVVDPIAKTSMILKKGLDA